MNEYSIPTIHPLILFTLVSGLHLYSIETHPVSLS